MKKTNKHEKRDSRRSEPADIQINECRIKSRRRIFFFHENRSSLWLHNIHEVETLRIKIDKCEFKDNEGIRCDYMLVAPDTEIYIELKGTDISHAVEQIRATLRRMSREFRKSKRKAYIICTRFPAILAGEQDMKRDFKRDENCDLIICTSLPKCPPSNNPIYQF